MSEKEAIEQIESLIDDTNSFIDPTDKSEDNIFRKDKEALQTVLQLLEQKDKRIDDYIEEKNRLKNKMTGDKMEQFDDYVIYLIEKYLKILEK